MKDTELAEIRAQLVAMSVVKPPPPKPSLFGRIRARAPQASSRPHVGGPSDPRAEARPAEQPALLAPAVEAAPVQADLPYVPPEPLRRHAFGQRSDTPDEPPLLLSHPVEPEAVPTGARALQKRLSSWLSPDQAYEVPAYAQDVPLRRESDLRIAAELAETPYEPEDLVEDIVLPIEDTTLADDLARARAAVEQVGAIVRADAAAPRVVKAKAAPRRAAKPAETPEVAEAPNLAEAIEHTSAGSEVLQRLHQALLTEQLRVDEAFSSLAEPAALAA